MKTGSYTLWLHSLFLIVNLFLLTSFFTSCNSESDSDTSLTVFKLEANYPEKEFYYEDYFDVSYIPIRNTTPVSDFTLLYAGKQEIIGYSSDTFLFLNRDGQITHRFSHQGNGRGEYNTLEEAFYDPQSEELFICDKNKKLILVYDRYGNLLRDFTLNTKMPIEKIKNATPGALLIYTAFMAYTKEHKPPMSQFLLLSKQDGSLIRDLSVPEKEIHTPSLLIMDDNSVSIIHVTGFPIHDARNALFITSPSCDTIYRMLKDQPVLYPYIVSVPPVSEQSGKETQKRYLFLCLDTPDIQLFSIIKTLEKTGYLYNKNEKQFYKLKDPKKSYKRINASVFGKSSSVYGTYAETFQATELLQALQEDKQITNPLEKRMPEALEEIAATLREEDNPVLAIYTLKKRN